jgi:DNA-binding MarR family transcriptional regulator
VIRSLAIEAFLEVLRTAGALEQRLATTLKGAGLTPAQYSVLRILRGAHPHGLPCGEIAARMLTRDPDMTRLLDRMERRELVSRCREAADRRVVLTRITEPGLAVLDQLDEPVRRMHEDQFGDWSDADLRSLMAFLEAARAAGGRSK